MRLSPSHLLGALPITVPHLQVLLSPLRVCKPSEISLLLGIHKHPLKGRMWGVSALFPHLQALSCPWQVQAPWQQPSNCLRSLFLSPLVVNQFELSFFGLSVGRISPPLPTGLACSSCLWGALSICCLSGGNRDCFSCRPIFLVLQGIGRLSLL